MFYFLLTILIIFLMIYNLYIDPNIDNNKHKKYTAMLDIDY